VYQNLYQVDPFTGGQKFSQVTMRRLIAIRMKNKPQTRSPGKPPESPADHDHGHGNDDKDHGPHEDHDNGYHNGQGNGHGHD